MVERFLSLAKVVASRQGYRFAPACEANLRSLVFAAIPKLTALDAVAQPHAIQTAENNLEFLVLEMIRNATPGEYELHEFTLSNARLKLCPLFPFC